MKLVGSVLSIILLAGCQAAPPPPNLNEVEPGVRDAFAAFRSSLDSRDFDSALGFYSDSPVFSWHEDGVRRYSSLEEVREAFAQLPTYGEVHFDFGELSVTVLSADIASLATTFKTSFGPADAPTFSFSGVWTATMQRDGDEWRAIAGHSSTEKTSADTERSPTKDS